MFACYEKSCAPPPAGKGGSLKARVGKWSADRKAASEMLMQHHAAVESARARITSGTTRVRSSSNRTGSEYTNSEALNTVRRRLAAQDAENQRKARAAARIKPTYSKANPPPGKRIGTPISKAEWEKMYRKNTNYSEHD